MMMKDHSMASSELMGVAKAKNITLPASASEKCQKKIQELREKKGVDFDKAYTDFMVDDHKEDIDAFKKEAEKGNDSVLVTLKFYILLCSYLSLEQLQDCITLCF